ncbi:hypothetical protein DFH08DRAFT_947965 [Mycena albidolilacea]|uniref:DUF6534 domain-containing protein n=1 Tax=Mycena albidolilacea TaxID=1033008 RepID=A0AAD7AW08_9AGAR|nr:hypothetical protein DFH08DRAFT_947965 [Mycena albidolilacea]
MTDGLDSITLTLGAWIVGCMIAVGLSAIVGFQTFLYFQIFPMDTIPYKFLVAWIWVIDVGHTVSLCTTIWQYAVQNFTNPDILLTIVPAYPIVIIFTLVATLNANLFYAWRIHKMSNRNWWLTGPIGYVVAGLAVSVATDIFISAARYYYLHHLKQGYMDTQEMVDAIVIFTVNDGLLTCATLIASMICFLVMKKNFIWIAFYVIVAKLFANSILATLNLRNWYRHRHRPMGIRLTQASRNTLQVGSPSKIQSSASDDLPSRMEVFIDQHVEYNVQGDKYKKHDGETGSQS